MSTQTNPTSDDYRPAGRDPTIVTHDGPTTRPHSAPPVPKTVRRRSERMMMGLPLWEVATGPDPSRGEERGHARAIFATGDIADGFVAIGGIARGVFSVGGVAFGVFSLGGVSLSLLMAIGGVAIAPFSFGGASVGGVAIGGAAVGVYAKGAAATGRYTMDRKEQDPEAVDFFRKWGLTKVQPKSETPKDTAASHASEPITK